MQDIVHARKSTKCITEQEFLIKGVPFCFVDVGGQRSQRQRWYQCFDSVRSILFFAASNEFDRFISDDDHRRLNRLTESCDIFELIVNNTAFAEVSIILFLNKTDLLTEKVKTTPIGDYFAAFRGNWRVLSDVQKFELSLFDERRRNRSQLLYHHFTTAVDTENILVVFRAVRDTILDYNMRQIIPQ